MKKWFLLLLCGCLLCASLSACGSTNSSNSPDGEVADDNAKQTVEVRKKDVVLFGETEWIVLSVEDEKIFLISKYCQAKGNFSEENDSSCAWDSSQIRTWLNSTYYSETFSPDEQASILETEVVNLRGENTIDKLFLLDEQEFNQYLSEDERATGYTDEQNVWWWLRSPGGEKDKVACVDDKGGVLQIVKAFNPNGIEQGVRPVMWVSKDADLKLVEEEPEQPAPYTKEEFMNIIEDESFKEADLIQMKANLPEKLTTAQLKEIIVGTWKTGSCDDDGNFIFSDEISEFYEDGTAQILGRDDYDWVVNNNELVINDTLEIEFRKAAEDCYWCYYVNEGFAAVYIKE